MKSGTSKRRVCRNTTPTGGDGNECWDAQKTKTTHKTIGNEMVEPR